MDAINQPLLSVRDLSVAFHQQSGTTVAVDRISFEIKRGECVALVGESGSGKSVSALSVLKLLPYPNASHPSGNIRFKGRELLNLSEHEIRGLRGNDISIIFQEPMTSLNPLHTIEAQIGEILRLHQPTTALDVTVQAQILALLADIRARLGMSLLFITHDLGIVRRIADTVCVMNGGKIVDGVSLAVRKGETLGVVGESGSGKTTLGLALLRLISSDGPIVFLGQNIQGLQFKAMRPFRRDMQIVFQDPFGSLSPRMSVGDIVAEGLTVHQAALSREEREAKVVKALTDVGLDPETRFRYPHEFSGGQRQRISIARAAVLEPNFVVLDEPTSALDMLFQAQMVDLLRELQRKRDLTYMFISHDLRVVASLASHLIVMRLGKVVEEGPASELFKNPKTDYTRALFAAAFRLETET